MLKPSTPLIAAVALLVGTNAWAETEKRDMDEFTKIAYSLPFEVEFVVADEHFVTLEGDADTIDEITTEVDGDTLKIYKEDSWFDWSDETIVLTVGFEEVSSVRMSGSGDGFAEIFESDEFAIKIAGSALLEIEKLICNDLAIAIAGSGDVQLSDVEADTLTTSIAGSGNVDVSGRVVSQKISISGSGDHNARDLRSQEADISVRGSGDVEVWAVAELDASVMGSGDISYYGNPKVDESIMGSGSLERRGDEP